MTDEKKQTYGIHRFHTLGNPNLTTDQIRTLPLSQWPKKELEKIPEKTSGD